MARCLAIRPNLRAWRCSNPAGKRWFCHQHRRWPVLCLIGLLGAVVLPMGIAYTWGLVAPPTRVESEHTALLQDIKKVLENNTPAQLKDFFNSKGLIQRYPLGFALFYSNGLKTLRYETDNSGIDLSKMKVVKFEQNQVCIEGGMTVHRPTLTLKENVKLQECFNPNGPGSDLLQLGDDVMLNVEPLAGSAEGAAWVVGLRPWVRDPSQPLHAPIIRSQGT